MAPLHGSISEVKRMTTSTLCLVRPTTGAA